MSFAKRHNAVALLTASAASLLSTPSFGDAPPSKGSVSFRVSRYAEKELAESKVLKGSTGDRFVIDIQQISFLKPLGSHSVFTANVLLEAMTGASPLGAVKVDDDDIRVAMSGASIQEERRDIALGSAWYGDSTTLNISAGKSVENDYWANYASVGLEKSFNGNTSTLGMTISGSNDVLAPIDAEEANRIRRAEKEVRSIFFGFTQVVSKKLIFQIGLGISRLSGYLSDPYKAGSIVNPQDRRPSEREKKTWTFGTRYYMESVESAFQFDYRYFNDTWEIDSHTVRIGLAREVGRDWQLGANIRWYMQGEADFYEPYPVPQVETQPDYFSMDYRLSPYGAISLNLHGKWEFALDWTAVFVLERYESDAGFSVASIQLENPAIVDFVRGSIGIDYRF